MDFHTQESAECFSFECKATSDKGKPLIVLGMANSPEMVLFYIHEHGFETDFRVDMGFSLSLLHKFYETRILAVPGHKRVRKL